MHWRSLFQPGRLCGAGITLLGAAIAAQASRYELGEIARMGPGYLPLLLGSVLTLLGLAILIDEWGSGERFPLVKLRPILAVTAGLAAWIVLAERAGFIAATTALIVLASFAEREVRLPPVLIAAALISLIAGIIFVIGFGVPLPLWPW